MKLPRAAALSMALPALAALGFGCGGGRAPGPRSHVIEIDIDDHGLGGLWMANAPNIKGLIARGTLAFSRVVVPTHSNQNNISLLTGQYPDGNDTPANDWLAREAGFVSPVSLEGQITLGDYALYDKNPLLTRGDSVYRATRAAGGRSAYVGELPPFEAGADDVRLSIVGTMFATSLGPLTVDTPTAKNILTGLLDYPNAVADGYGYDGPPQTGETQTRFTLRDAADFIRAASPAHPVPDFLFVWDFVGLDGDPTSAFGSDGPQIAQIIADYDAGLGELLSALEAQGLTESTNVLFTLDHGKVDAHNQVVLGTHGGAGADGQLGALVAARGPALGIDSSSYALLNEDGDGQIYAVVSGAGSPAGAAAQADVTRKLLTLVQSGAIVGLDTTRTLTADGALGTRSFRDFRASSPHQADIVVFPKDDWTLNQVDPVNAVPGPFLEHTQYAYGRHGGFSADELYVPLIMAGPAFKRGVMLPHPVLHPEVAPTALGALAGLRTSVALETAARGAIRAALAGNPGETIPVPDPPETARDAVLLESGFEATQPPSVPASSVVIIDVAGLYDDELFDDPVTSSYAAAFQNLAAQGTRFEDCWADSRDWPVTEYQILTGGYPVAPYVPAAEDDPTVTFPPGQGLLAMPPPPSFVANQEGFTRWRAPTRFAADSLFDAAHALGLRTALLGVPDFHTLHIDLANIDQVSIAGAGTAAAATFPRAARDLIPAAPALTVAVFGGPRASDRHSAAAMGELQTLGTAVSELVGQLLNRAGTLVVITSRGATPIDDPAADFYGPGSSRHVPLILLGPGVRPGIVSGQPATPADIPATVLFALGAPTTTDVALGTYATGPAVGGVPRPNPSTATLGHALLRAFLD